MIRVLVYLSSNERHLEIDGIGTRRGYSCPYVPKSARIGQDKQGPAQRLSSLLCLIVVFGYQYARCGQSYFHVAKMMR